MSGTKKSKKIRKHIVDVQAPGTSAPPPTSKPVIVTNRSLLRDPMVTDVADQPPDDEPKPAAERAADTSAPSHEAVIKPLDSSAADDSAPDDGEEQADSPASAETSSAVEGTEEAASSPEEKDDVPEENEPEVAVPDQSPESDAAAEPPAPADSDSASAQADQVPGDTPKPPAAKQAEIEAAVKANKAKHEAEIQQLVDSRQYELPINTTEQQKSKRFVLLGTGLAIILIIIWLDIALDAGIIKLGGLKSLTHFFSN